MWGHVFRKLFAIFKNVHVIYGHLPPITKTIQVRQTRQSGHCLRSRDELISDVLLWTPTYGRAKPGRPARTYIQQLWEDTGCSPEDLPEAKNYREKWRERVRDIRAGGTTWWWKCKFCCRYKLIFAVTSHISLGSSQYLLAQVVTYLNIKLAKYCLTSVI